MKKNYLILSVFILLCVGCLFFLQRRPDSTTEKIAVSVPVQEQVTSPEVRAQEPIFKMPLSDALSRVSKKPFGIEVSPKNSPVSPERFTGIHTGVDFEVFENELDIAVPVFAICDGTLLRKQFGPGYGGYVVESCELEGQPITVVYGHLQLASVATAVGGKVKAGSQIGILGKGFSAETDGERKHLHLGIHKGNEIVTSGYVSTQEQLAGWVDFRDYFFIDKNR